MCTHACLHTCTSRIAHTTELLLPHTLNKCGNYLRAVTIWCVAIIQNKYSSSISTVFSMLQRIRYHNWDVTLLITQVNKLTECWKVLLCFNPLLFVYKPYNTVTPTHFLSWHKLWQLQSLQSDYSQLYWAGAFPIRISLLLKGFHILVRV